MADRGQVYGAKRRDCRRVRAACHQAPATWNGSEDGFVARFKLDGAGTADLKYSTFIGGVNWDNLFAVALNPTNPEIVTLAGFSCVNVISGTKVPTTAGSVKPVLTPNPPATPLFPEVKFGFVTQFRFPSTGGGTMVWSSLAGGNFDDFLSDVAVDETGAVTVLGGRGPTICRPRAAPSIGR